MIAVGAFLRRYAPFDEPELERVAASVEIEFFARVLRARPRGRCAEGRGSERCVADVMTSPVVTVPEDAPAEEALSSMLKHGVHHLPVTDGDRVVGVVSDTDLMGLERTTPFALIAAIERAPTARRSPPRVESSG
jgi:CBS domain-containing protein